MKCCNISLQKALLNLHGPTSAEDKTPQIVTVANFTLNLRRLGFHVSLLFLRSVGHWFKNSTKKLTMNH